MTVCYTHRFSRSGFQAEHNSNGLLLLHDIWGLRLKDVKLGGWNHLKTHSHV